MGGRRQPGPVGGHEQIEDVDQGTLARIRMPSPRTTSAGARTPTLPNAHAPVEPPTSGGIPYAIGQASVVRIPIPGTNGLCIELTPRGWTPKGGSTSTLFFHDAAGKRHLRRDYGYSVN